MLERGRDARIARADQGPHSFVQVGGDALLPEIDLQPEPGELLFAPALQRLTQRERSWKALVWLGLQGPADDLSQLLRHFGAELLQRSVLAGQHPRIQQVQTELLGLPVCQERANSTLAARSEPQRPVAVGRSSVLNLPALRKRKRPDSVPMNICSKSWSSMLNAGGDNTWP